MFSEIGLLANWESNPAPEDTFISGQARYAKFMLNNLNMPDAPVMDNIHEESELRFRDRKVLALSSLDEINLSIAVAAGMAFDLQEDPDTIVIIPTPTREGSGILEDEDSETLYTDSFWTFERGALVYVKPTSPVQIDDINISYDIGDRDSVVLRNKIEIKKALFKLSNDKHKTREVLKSAGIRVPEGVYLENWERDIKLLFDFLADHIRAGVVVKDLVGSHGEGVAMFDLDSYGQAIDFAHFMLAEGENENGEGSPFLIEKRIAPPVSSEQKLKFGIPDDGELDYNFRVLVTVDSGSPVLVDSEVRYKVKNENPVNITYEDEDDRASAALTHEFLLSQDVIDGIHQTAIHATRAISAAALGPNGKPVGEIAGVDLMIDESGNAVVIEVNAGGAVGGIGTLTRLSGKPPESIMQVLLPNWQGAIEKKPRRTVLSSGSLKRLRHNRSDENTLLNTFHFSGMMSDMTRFRGRERVRAMNPLEYMDLKLIASDPFITSDERNAILHEALDNRTDTLDSLNLAG